MKDMAHKGMSCKHPVRWLSGESNGVPTKINTASMDVAIAPMQSVGNSYKVHTADPLGQRGRNCIVQGWCTSSLVMNCNQSRTSGHPITLRQNQICMDNLGQIASMRIRLNQMIFQDLIGHDEVPPRGYKISLPTSPALIQFKNAKDGLSLELCVMHVPRAHP